ncbi:hypothetical protein [Demequina aurantiaca]|uniref:hypothetical protein n=1 Tax=Demequina aurantiaca TaxID=676200 RepID=UPI003D33779D
MTWTSKHDESFFCVEIHEIWAEDPALVQGFRGEVLDISPRDLSEGVIGSLAGYIARGPWRDLLALQEGLPYSDLRVAPAIADKRESDARDNSVSVVVLVKWLVLSEPYRRRGLSLTILLKALEELGVEPSGALVLIRPEPLSADGTGGLPDGSESDQALVRVHSAIRDAGFEPWEDGPIWSLAINGDCT